MNNSGTISIKVQRYKSTRVLTFLLFYFCTFVPSIAFAWSVIANTCAGTSDGGDGSSPLVSSSINTTGANFIIVYSSTYSGAYDIALSDSSSNSWHALTNTNDSRNSQLWYAFSATVSGSHTFTLSGASFYNPAFCVMALSGASTSDPFDVQNASSNYASETIAPGSITPTQNNDLVVSGLASSSALTAPTIGGGFTVVNSITGAGHDLIGLAYLIQTTATAANPTWTITGGLLDNQASIAAFKETGAAPSPRRRMVVGIQ